MSSNAPKGPCTLFAKSGTRIRSDLQRSPNLQGTNTSITSKKPARGQRKVKPQAQIEPKGTHLDDFFAKYPTFPYNPSKPVVPEFFRMSRFLGWKRSDEEQEEAHELFKVAMVMQFNDTYGTNVKRVTSWRKLCEVLGISPIPEGRVACQTAVMDTHVNLVDLVDTPRTGRAVVLFKSEKALSNYTKNTRKFFPRDSAYAGGLLRFLLRRILNPPSDDEKGRGGRGGGRGRG
ncbi:hypothetical protein BOTBODRAFT_170847 [Botryobasidium botryosum FD-172 SS1]|uniref:Uncharacterized protein n=1 Tax=Botryobasidium botryosum (strain FD-172 SS1) TaxID=930990 RepID=A0A067N543_BOTB1|nr:hypothetical protein BOTBODRAFT_170847 [Botryobasidium botryosum FD-172 SS1]